MRRMADDLDFLETRLPQRAAARTSRQALADYYGTSPEGAMTNWRPPREALVPDAGSPARRAILSGRGGVGGGEPPQFTDSGDSMSSSDEEEVSSAFKPGMDNPEDFFQEVRVKTAHRKKRGASASSSLLGELIRRIDGTDDAAELLQWIDANAVPVPPVAGGPPIDIPLEGAPAEGGAGGIAAVAAATVEQLQRAFVHRFPLTGAQDRAEEALQKIKQRSKMLDHDRAYNKQMMRSSKIPNLERVSLEAITARTERMAYIKSTAKRNHKLMIEEFGDIESMRTHLIRRVHQLPNLHALQAEAELYETQELEPIAVSSGVPGAAYWLRSAPVTVPVTKKKVKGLHAVESEGLTEECLLIQDMHTSKLDLMTKQITEIREEMIELDRRSTERSDARLKEQRKEVEDDLIKPLTMKTDKIEGLLQQNQTAQAEILQLLKTNAANNVTTPQMQVHQQGVGNSATPRFGMFNQSRPQYGRPRSQFQPANGQTKRPLICFHCKKPGHPFRLCPELSVNMIMQISEAVQYWDQGGTDVCSVEELRGSFDESGVMDDTLLCNLITRWAEDELYKSLGETVRIPAARKLSVSVQMNRSNERLGTSVSEQENTARNNGTIEVSYN